MGLLVVSLHVPVAPNSKAVSQTYTQSTDDYIASLGHDLVERVLKAESKHLDTLLHFPKPWSTHHKMRTMTVNEVVGVVKMGDIYAAENRLTHKQFSVHFLSFCPPILLPSFPPSLPLPLSIS